MDLRAQSAFMAALIAAVLAVAVSLRATERRHAQLFALLSGNLSVWLLTDFLLAATGGEIFSRLILVSGAAMPVSAYRFFQAFPALHTHAPTPPPIMRKGFERALLGGAILSTAVAFSPLVRSFIARSVVATFAFGSLLTLFYLAHQQRNLAESRIERTRVNYVVVGGIIALGFAGTAFIPGLSGLFAAIGNIGIVVYLFFLSQAVLQHRLLDLNELLGRIVVLSGLALLLALVFGFIVVAVGDSPPILLFNLLLTALVLLTISDPLRSRIERRVMAWLFAERYELTGVLGRLRRELPGIIDPTMAAERLLERIYETNRITHASFYVLSADATGYRRVAHRGPEPPRWIDATSLAPLVENAQEGKKAVLRETLELSLTQARSSLRQVERPVRTEEDTHHEPPAVARLARSFEAMERMGSGVAVPLLGTSHGVVGFLNLRDERVYEAFSSNEIAALIMVSEVLATLVENSKLYERMKERDRLAALGEMAAGLAHEIRNPLGAIKAAAQYLDPESMKGDEGEFLQIIIDETDRLNGVVSQFLDYARPLKAKFTDTDLNEVVRKTLRLLEKREIPETVGISLALEEGLPPIQADPEQLQQVLINLALNAVQAMGGEGRLELRTRLRPAPGGGPHQPGPGSDIIELRVADTGPGISATDRANLFIPFFTTKERGTGLGLPICQRLIRNHGGTLEVFSRTGMGTEFVVRLPLSGGERLGTESVEEEEIDEGPGGVVVPLRRKD
ncbi:MAG: ATP-binding protein [Deltaproteobacteria bacterium]|nr:ATP-binding protein [Deltaproteobacteria bacterium]